MSARPLPNRLTVDDVIRIAARLMAEQGKTPAEAAEIIMAEHEFAAGAIEYFLELGITRAINEVHKKARNASPVQQTPTAMPHALDRRPGGKSAAGETPYRDFLRFQPRWAHGRDLESALSRMFQGAHTKMKPLWDFLEEDWRELLRRELAQVRGHASKAKAVRGAIETLRRFDAATARELPAGAQKSLESAVAEAWRG